NKKLICVEPEWNNAREWVDGSNTDANAGRDPDGDGIMNNVSAPITLQAGKKYYIQVVHQEGGGGDSVGVLWVLPGGAAPQKGDLPISGEFVGFYTNPDDLPAFTVVEASGSPTFDRVRVF